MDSQVILERLVVIGGLIGGTALYARLLRKRGYLRAGFRAMAASSRRAVDRMAARNAMAKGK